MSEQKKGSYDPSAIGRELTYYRGIVEKLVQAGILNKDLLQGSNFTATVAHVESIQIPVGLTFKNGGQQCDMLFGPCACGAWHKLEDLVYRIFNQLKESPSPAVVEETSVREQQGLEPVGKWGKFPTFAAKIGTMGSSCVLVKRTRKFSVGQTIQYVNESDLRGMSTGCTPKWERGYIWKIEGNRLFINR